MLGLAQRVAVARARASRDAAVQHCLEYLGSEHPDFELEGSVTVINCKRFMGLDGGQFPSSSNSSLLHTAMPRNSPTLIERQEERTPLAKGHMA